MSLHLKQIQQAYSFLMALDDDWAKLIADIDPCTLEPKIEREPYEALIRAVAYQQLHPKAGDAIIKKWMNHYAEAFPSPFQIIATDLETLSACGLSGRKIETIHTIAKASINGFVPSRTEAEVLSDEDLIERLVMLKGIGRWTVEMFLMFTMARMDILPADDFAILQGYKRLKKLKSPPTRKEMVGVAKNWSPYRTIASWYLWRVPK